MGGSGPGKVPVIKYPLANYLSLNAEVLGVVSSELQKMKA
jgi:hypothetical protein